MTSSSVKSASKRTNVRAEHWRQRALRSALRTLLPVAPTAAEALFTRLFFTPFPPRQARPLEVWDLEPRPFRVATGEAELFARSYGDGPAVLLAHGWEGRSDQLLRFVTPLVARGFRVVAFDMPAHGRSSGRRVSVVHMARAIRAVAAVVGPVHAVVAHSLGATATALAVTEGLPVKRVALIAPASNPGAYARRAAASLGLSEESTVRLVRRIEAWVGVGMEALDLSRRVGSLEVPALVLHDPADREVAWAEAEALARAWPDAKLEPLHGYGHRRMLKDLPVIERVAAFVADDERTGRIEARPQPHAPAWDWFSGAGMQSA